MQFPQITCEPEEKGQILDTKTRILTENFFHRPPPPGSDDSDSKSSSTPSPGHDPENGDDNVNQGPDQSARNDGDAYRYEDDVSGYDVISNYMNEGGLQNMNGNENQGVDEDMDGDIYDISNCGDEEQPEDLASEHDSGGEWMENNFDDGEDEDMGGSEDGSFDEGDN
jgi:hypothetical protein